MLTIQSSLKKVLILSGLFYCALNIPSGLVETTSQQSSDAKPGMITQHMIIASENGPQVTAESATIHDHQILMNRVYIQESDGRSYFIETVQWPRNEQMLYCSGSIKGYDFQKNILFQAPSGQYDMISHEFLLNGTSNYQIEL